MIENLLKDALKELADSGDLIGLENIRIKYLGKTGLISNEMRKLGTMGPDERKSQGAIINKAKEELEKVLSDKKNTLEIAFLNNNLSKEGLDITLPARSRKQGSIHPISKAYLELTEIFASFGFEVKEGSSIEDDWHNFTALNIDENHPARQMHDTFYMNADNMLLRTHTSPVQIHTMKAGKPPFKFIAPGRVYRCDSDMTHTPMFHQIEGLLLDKDTNLGNMKFVIVEFIKHFFETSNMEFRFRSSFFPFTEPSFEVDIKMPNRDKWLEVLGCGMIHPDVLRNANIDPAEYRGFAFGMGLERFAMLKYGISDLRQFFEGDMRWTRHYNFSIYDIPSKLGGLTK
ncbi:MAG UNVERIFIED_CONTAM: phenylalanine--tRNA ligase subunit alpha [Rickettsiaceae bacterium]